MGLYTGYKFATGTNVTYTFNASPFSSIGVYSFRTSYFQSLLAGAFDEWDNNLNFNFTYTSVASQADIYLGWTFLDGRSGTLGVNIPVDPDGNGIVSGPDEGYNLIVLDLDDSSMFSPVIRHEIGHALGLGHDNTEGSLMNPYLDGSETITEYDLAKAAAIYGYNSAGSTGADSMVLSQQADFYAAQAGNDSVWGGAGNDLLYGNHGLDILSGGSGNDVLYGGQNAGNYSGSPAALRDGIETIDGGAGDDILYGNHGGDIVIGGAGSDTLYGGQDADQLFGGAGDDVLHGNLGADTFFYNSGSAQNEGNDTIIGFVSGQDSISVGYGTATSQSEQAGDTVIVLNTGTTIVLQGVTGIADPFLI